ncbi:hypothetical protein WJX74_003315 [Apatococcus lobatus]|uniref:Uncharacterized protein n=1 Tax=Apatococcus lobatus TaxID=904363 RepID=A0AAW1Q1G7_9CHLO
MPLRCHGALEAVSSDVSCYAGLCNGLRRSPEGQGFHRHGVESVRPVVSHVPDARLEYEHAVLRRVNNETIDTESRCIWGCDKIPPASGLSSKKIILCHLRG